MKPFRIAAMVVALAQLTSVSANAQVSVDIAKITCDQFVLFQITDPRNIAIWISGYYNGKRNNTVIDTQVFGANFEKLKDYCRANSNLTVMQAVEKLFVPAQ
jgi:hypothetical protein